MATIALATVTTATTARETIVSVDSHAGVIVLGSSPKRRTPSG